MVQGRIGEFVEQGRQVVDELVGIEANVSRQPGTYGLAHPADHKVRGGLDPVVLGDLQRTTDVLAGQYCEQRAGLGALAYQHGVGR